MESGQSSQLLQAIDIFTYAATNIGLEILFCGHAEPDEQASKQIPKVGEVAKAIGWKQFYDSQPSAIYQLKSTEENAPVVMFNFHMDTVGPHIGFSSSDHVYYGRGIADNKGPGVALLSAIRHWMNKRTTSDIPMTILIQCVAGEEGGAMGIYGTRPLIKAGYFGDLNVFMIPSGGGYFDRSTSSMTLEISVDGEGSTDDFPERGVNATLILSAIVAGMASDIEPVCQKANVKLTVGGLTSGSMHNRVYGSGHLLINFSYASVADAELVRIAVEKTFPKWLRQIDEKYSTLSTYYVTAKRCSACTSFRWLKQGLPTLSNSHPLWEQVLKEAGIRQQSASQAAFTCDAMWGNLPGRYTIMYGPGDLHTNGAHTELEHLTHREMEDYAESLVQLLDAISRNVATLVDER